MLRKITAGILIALFFFLGIFFYWPFGIVAILMAAIAAWNPAAILIGILLDLVYGVPPNGFHFLFFPFTIFAVLMTLTTMLAKKYFTGSQQDEFL